MNDVIGQNDTQNQLGSRFLNKIQCSTSDEKHAKSDLNGVLSARLVLQVKSQTTPRGYDAFLFSKRLYQTFFIGCLLLRQFVISSSCVIASRHA